MVRASCLCGGVVFHVPPPTGPVVACHCIQCRKLSGHYSASFDADEDLVRWESRSTEGQFATPGGGVRGFCTRCGSSQWFRDRDGAFSVEAGAIDGPLGVKLAEHIFVASKGDYYDLTDGLPQHEGSGDV
jgi:hypothetical protein